VTVFSRAQASREAPRPDTIVISISRPGDRLDLPGWEHVFHFEFDDVPGPEERVVEGRDAMPFTSAMARELIEILNRFPGYDIICHCDAGASRSAAVARFIADETGRTPFFLGFGRADALANRHVLRLLQREARRSRPDRATD
jgi:predicted protein tyrosine phosphatase